MDSFRFRLNCVDHYQSPPTIFDPVLNRTADSSRNTHDGSAVPVIRAFGATETGQKVCAHIHGALPYLYLKYDGPVESLNSGQYISVLRTSIDQAMAKSFRRNPSHETIHYVGHISLVKGIPFFGYHVGYEYYFKVYMLNPLHMTRLADLLLQGAILGKVLQPHESHLQYLLQWMCDYNLYGCAYIIASEVKFRSPIPDSLGLNSLAHRWHNRSIPPECVSDSDLYPKQSHCSLEVDICVEHITNRSEVKQRPIHHDFVEKLMTSTSDEKLVQSMAGLWRDETRRRKKRMGIVDPHSSPFPPDVLISMSADIRNDAKGGWIHEDDHSRMLEHLIQDEKNSQPKGILKAESLTRANPYEGQLRTALESVEDLHSKNAIQYEPSSTFMEAKEDPEYWNENWKQHNSSDPPESQGVSHIGGEYFKDPLNASKSDRSASIGQKLDSNVGQARHQNACQAGTEEFEEYLRANSAPSSPETGDLSHSYPHAQLRVDHMDHLSYVGSERSSRRDQIDVVIENVSSQITGSEQSSDLDDEPDYSGAAEHATAKATQQGLYSDKKENADQSQHSSISSQGSSMFRGFPVVKFPNDPSTVSRISRRKVSGSRMSPEVQCMPQKMVAQENAFPQSSRSGSNLRSNDNATCGTNISPEAISFATQLGKYRSGVDSTKTLLYGSMPPNAASVGLTMSQAGLEPILYQNAYYSNEMDVPEKPQEYGGQEHRPKSATLPFLATFDPLQFDRRIIQGASRKRTEPKRLDEIATNSNNFCKFRNWEIASRPPSIAQVAKFFARHRERVAKTGRSDNAQSTLQRSNNKSKTEKLSQIEGPTQGNKHGFRFKRNRKSTSVQHETQYMSIMSLEVHVNTRKSCTPDPAEDEIACLFWCLQDNEVEDALDLNHSGIIALQDSHGVVDRLCQQTDVEVEVEEDELDLINRIISIVRVSDPDILTGYEVHNGSWGFLIERARLKYDYDLCDELSRMKSNSHGRFGKDMDRWGFAHTSTIRVTGRHMINIWRAMRGELNLLQYTMENVVFHLLNRRIPHYSFQVLTEWYKGGLSKHLTNFINYFVSRSQMNLEILEANELIARTSEQARLLGVDFFSVFSRGSQFKVESLMFRIAKPENFILVSPSRKQVGQQNALECLPLVMEPQSAFYTSPVVVLDFQSLYPSIMIAYNYCYSTCLGRIANWRGQNKLGFADFKRQPGLLELQKEHINIAPNGIMFVKPQVRKSLLAKMLGEILETRVMVKSGMKLDQDDHVLQQLLNNRQLALKLIANVTYGYTSASFSGRMPCSEIADSIVQTGRETLEKAIALIHSTEQWGAEVVYGDTDSIFVCLRGRSRNDAFAIGQQIAESITESNPRPVKLKFEKVYHPCVLLAKKRYVGFKFEKPSQSKPDFDAKGIETIRRDGTPAEQKIEETALKELFRTSNLSKVKAYFQRQCYKIMTGRVSLQDFLFAREVKLGSYSDKGPPPPGALIATRRMLLDHRSEPQYGERVPFVVVTGAPGSRLIDRCVSPEALMHDKNMELDAEYYISKNLIPPLERIFNLMGANVRQWYEEMPKVQRIQYAAVRALNMSYLHAGDVTSGIASLKKRLENYMRSSACIVCKVKLSMPIPQADQESEGSPLPLCQDCLCRSSTSLLQLRTKVKALGERVAGVESVCRNCASLAFGEEVRCDSGDCPVFYTRVKEQSTFASIHEGLGDVCDALEMAGVLPETYKRVPDW